MLAVNAFAAKDHGYIKARGGPDDAAIYINGKYAGPASRYTVPEKYEAPLGQVEVAVRDARCEDYVTKVTVRPGKTVHLHYKLKWREQPKPPFGTFKLSGESLPTDGSLSAGDAGAVYINNRYVGYVAQLKSLGSGILLNPGNYNLRIESAEYGNLQQTFAVTADKTTVVKLPEPH